LVCDACKCVNKLDVESIEALEDVLKDILLFNNEDEQSDIMSKKI
jgi:hypothetical protein